MEKEKIVLDDEDLGEAKEDTKCLAIPLSKKDKCNLENLGVKPSSSRFSKDQFATTICYEESELCGNQKHPWT